MYCFPGVWLSIPAALLGGFGVAALSSACAVLSLFGAFALVPSVLWSVGAVHVHILAAFAVQFRLVLLQAGTAPADKSSAAASLLFCVLVWHFGIYFYVLLAQYLLCAVAARGASPVVYEYLFVWLLVLVALLGGFGVAALPSACALLSLFGAFAPTVFVQLPADVVPAHIPAVFAFFEPQTVSADSASRIGECASVAPCLVHTLILRLDDDLPSSLGLRGVFASLVCVVVPAQLPPCSRYPSHV